jgi:hypothetical protein
MKTDGWTFNHVGLPTDKVQKDEIHFKELGLYATDPAKTEFFIEYLRPEPGCTFFPILLKNPHVSYQVPDLNEALKGLKVVVEPFSPMPGRMIAFVEVDGFIFELAYDEPKK